ncbi:Anion exchange protein [Dirofilaria immitis]|nr:Anion exchange protein [Dirofilaria immitis]
MILRRIYGNAELPTLLPSFLNWIVEKHPARVRSSPLPIKPESPYNIIAIHKVKDTMIEKMSYILFTKCLIGRQVAAIITEAMTRRGSSQPDIRNRIDSHSSLMRRRSITETYRDLLFLEDVSFKYGDLLLDPLYTAQPMQIGNHPESPIHNVRELLEAHLEETPLIYTEMLDLDKDDNARRQWKQVARWIKYEQTIEGDDTRFSKPHITLLSIIGLIQLKNCLRKGVILLDIEAYSFNEIAGIKRGLVDAENSTVVKDLLLCPKYHLIGKQMLPSTEIRNDMKTAIKILPTDDVENDVQEENILDLTSKEMKKLAEGTEGAAIMAGIFNGFFPELPNIPIPLRFVFVLLNPHDHYDNETRGIARAIGALLSDEVVVIPPGNCTTETRWEPNANSDQVARSVGMLYASYDDPFDEESVLDGKKKYTTILCEAVTYLVAYVMILTPYFASDFSDFFYGRWSQSFAAAIFLFFANVTSIITFGAVMEQALHHQVVRDFHTVCSYRKYPLRRYQWGHICPFSGQPLNILSATGPTLNKWLGFLPFRFWVSAWIGVVLLILVATDMSALVGLITRFTEEAFAALISIIFIIQSFEKLIEISHDAPIIIDPKSVLDSPCICHLDEQMVLSNNISMRPKIMDIDVAECNRRGGEALGLQCHFKPDVYMLSILLTFGTFALAYGLNIFRRTHFLNSMARNSISDFGVFIAIVVMTAISKFIGLDLPVLDIPTNFRQKYYRSYNSNNNLQPTIDRSWLINPLLVNWYVALMAVIPAIFYAILIVMDQQITAVIINRKDNKLRKGFGYHLDLLVIALLIVICGSLGLPIYVAATVLSVMHVDSLRLQSDTSAPGEKAQFLGVKEQRLTAIIAHLFIGFSVFITPVIKLVPLPVLIGIFLYMGVVSMLGLQFIQRIAMLFMPIKYQILIFPSTNMNKTNISQSGLIICGSELLALDDPVPSFHAVLSSKERSGKGKNETIGDEELENPREAEEGKKKLDGNR